MKLFGMRAGLLGGLFNRGGGSEPEAHDGGESSPTADRLSRISQRGKQDVPVNPYAGAPQQGFDTTAIPEPGYDAQTEQQFDARSDAPLELDHGFEEAPKDSYLPEHSYLPEQPYAPEQDFEAEQPYAADQSLQPSVPTGNDLYDGAPADLTAGVDFEPELPESVEEHNHTEAAYQEAAPLEDQRDAEPIDGPAQIVDEQEYEADALEQPAFEEETAFDVAAEQPSQPEEPVYEDYSEPAYPQSGQDSPAADNEPVHGFVDEPVHAEEPADDFMAQPALSADFIHQDERPRIMPTMNFATDFMADQPATDATGEFAIVAKKKKVSSLGLSPMVPGEDRDEGEEPAERTAIVFRQIFPAPHDEGLSFFGGLPRALDIEWPRGKDDVPYSFVMQLDCSEVPARARHGLPESGVLYVFMGLNCGDQTTYRVIHEDAGNEELGDIDAPEDLPPVYGAGGASSWKWPQAEADMPRLLPKWRFVPVAIDLPEGLWEEDGEEDPEAPRLWPSFGPAGDRLNQLLLEAQGEEIKAEYFTITDFDGAGGTLIRPWHQYPHDARAIQIASGLLLKRLDEKFLKVRSDELDSMSEAERAATLQRIREEAQGWYDDAAAEAPFIEVPQEVADQFWDWMCSFPWLARFVLSEAVTLSVEDSLAASAEAAARVPAEIAARIRHRHALASRAEGGSLQVNIPDRMIAPPVDVQGSQYERAQSHVLLFEMSSNEGLGHHFGEGVYQFWIKPDDLAAGRFDKVELTADAY